jgi:STE24 endopeptidase
MQLALVLVLAAALLAADNAVAGAVECGAWQAAAVALCASAVAAMAAAASFGTARGLRASPQRAAAWLAAFGRWRQAHLVLWLGACAAILFIFQWPRLVMQNAGLGGWFLVDETVILLPIIGPLVLSWTLFYEVERTLAGTVAMQLPAGCAEGATTVAPAGELSRWEYVALHARFFLGLTLGPLLVLVAIRDAAEFAWPGAARSASAPLVHAAPLAALVVLFPLLLRCVWRTTPLPAGSLRTRLESLAKKAGLAIGDIIVWQTGGRMVNAAVTGPAAPLRYVLLTDGLIERLGEDEIAAVFAHEAGHVRHRHLWLRMAVLILPVGLYAGVNLAAPSACAAISQWFADVGAGPSVQSGLILPAIAALYAWLVLGAYSRLLEHQADHWACRALDGGKTAAPAAAAERFIAALAQLAAEAGLDPRRASWLHPSIDARAAFARELARDPAKRARFERRLRRIAWALFAAGGASIAAVAMAVI